MLYREGKTASLETEYYPAQETEVYGDKQSKDFNKIFWWDNFQVICNLMKEYRGKIDLIYIDPPFDSKADYVKKIKFRGQEIAWREQSLLEETQYSDMRWKDEYLQFMYERLLLLRELLSESGSIYLHCDWHKSHHLRSIMDEVFWEDSFRNEIIWNYWWPSPVKTAFARKHDTILLYSKGENYKFNAQYWELPEYLYGRAKEDKDGRKWVDQNLWELNAETIAKMQKEGRIFETSKWGLRRKQYLDEMEWSQINDVWNIAIINSQAKEDVAYPTQKPEALLERIIKASSNEWDIVLDCFMWSGTTCAVAQKLWRKWIGCDINTWAINTSIKRLNSIIQNQQSEIKTAGKTAEEKNKNLWKPMISTPLAFKVYNVNEYNLFKNKEEWIETYKQIVMESYGVVAKRGYRDGETSSALVKIIDPNRILSKKDIDEIVKGIDDTSDELIYTRSPLKYKDIQIICSGKELDSDDYIARIKKEWKLNKDIDIQIKDLLVEKEWLLFKEKPYIEYKIDRNTEKNTEGNKNNLKTWQNLTFTITDFISPVLLKKLDIENKWTSDKVIIEDRKQTIDSVAIDVDYDWNLFNAEIIDSPSKKELIQWKYDLWELKDGIIAIKIIDILWEELFLTVDKR